MTDSPSPSPRFTIPKRSHLPPGRSRVVVQSIGTATAALVPHLARVLPLTTQEVVAALYKAPAVLLSGLDAQLAEQLATIVRESGAVVTAESMDAPAPEPGIELDVAVHLNDPGRLPEVAGRVATMLGSEAAQAAQMLCASPPTVLGGVSAATAEAMRAQLADLDVEVDTSARAQAVYDLLLVSEDAATRAAVTRALHRLGLPASAGPLVALGLTRAQADQVWSAVSRRDDVRLVDRAFQRFDVWLLSAPDTPEVHRLLVQQTGMPEKVAARVIAHAPLVLHEAIPHANATENLAELVAAGAEAEARLVTFQSFDLVVASATELRKTAEVLAQLLGQEVDAVHTELRRLPARFAGPLSHTRARWTEAELRKVGARVTLEAR